jgi:hypothetical protein
MRVEDFHAAVEGQDEWQPFWIRTRSGKRYRVPYRSSCWIPEAYQAIVILAVRGQGITHLDIEAIDSLQFEHEPAAP